jgi:Tol biopolymer transport system component
VAQALSAGNTGDVTGAGHYSIGPTGHLAYLPGGIVPYPDARLVTVDQDGRVTPLAVPVRSYDPALRVSPDGRRVAVPIRSLSEQSLWLYDLSRGVLTKVTTDREVTWPAWTPDGQRVGFLWLHDGTSQFAWQPADGSGSPERLADDVLLTSWAPDGQEGVGVTRYDIIGVTTREGTAQVRPILATPAREGWPAISPDGHWLAYASDVSGQLEVYLQPYPAPGPRTQVSIDGGSSPAWHPSGRALFFLAQTDPRDPARRRMMIVDVDLRGGPRLGTPRQLFEFRTADLGFACTPVRCYDVARDGQRFFVTQLIPPAPTPPVTHITLIQNWVEELKAKVPTR